MKLRIMGFLCNGMANKVGEQINELINKSTLIVNSPQSGAFISAGAKGSHPIYKEKGAYVNKVNDIKTSIMMLKSVLVGLHSK